MSFLWMDDQDFRPIELDRESRIPDEPYHSPSVERSPRSTTDDGVPLPGVASGRSTEGNYEEPPNAGRDPFGRPDPRTHPEYWTE